MSAVVGETASAGGQKYVNFDEYVDFQVNKTRSGIRHADLLYAVLAVLLVVSGYLLAFVVADQWLIEGGFGFAPRLMMLIGVVAFLGLWAVWRIVLPYLKRITALYAARELETSQPQLKSSLLTLVDLKRAERNVAPHILAAMEKRAALQLSQIDVDQAVDRRPLMRLAYALSAVVVALCLYTVLSPKPVGASILRALIPVADVGVATRTRIANVEPGNTTILARSQLEVTVDLTGEIPSEATLLYSTRDLSLVDEPVILRDTGEGLNRFRGTLSGPNGRGLLQDFTYHIAAGDAVSESFAVTVTQAPYATVESIAYTYPAYMGLDSKSQSGGDIDAWEGTQVALRAVTNLPVAGGMLRLHDSEDTSLKAEERPLRVVEGTHLELTEPWILEFRSDGSYPHYYSIDVFTEGEQHDPVPRLYGLTIRRDLPPEIRLLHPSGDIELPANAVLPVSFTARDPDFMLSKVHMRFEQRDQALDKKTRHLYDAPPFRAELSGRSDIELAQFNLRPGDVLTFWLEAWDNMAPLGNRPGNRTVTPKINIAITDPVAPEQVEQLRADEEAAAEERLEEAQAQSTAEKPDAEASDGDQAADGDRTEAASEEPAGSDNTAGQQPADPAEAGNPATESQGDAGDSADNRANRATQPPAERQPPSESEAEEHQPQDNSNPNGGEQQSQNGGAQNRKSAKDGDAGRQGSGSGADGASQSRPEPGSEAADDEALERLFKEYADEIKQQQQRRQQSSDSQSGDGTSGDERGNAESGSQPDADNQPPNSRSRDQHSSSDDRAGDSRSEGGEPSDDSTGDPQSGTQQTNDRQPQDNQRESPSQSDDSRPSEKPSPESGDRPPQQGRNNDRSNADPRANQDPRADQQDQSPPGRKPSERPDADDSEGQGDSPPMPGEGESSASSQSPENQTKGNSSASGQPDGQQPDGQQPDGQQPDGQSSNGNQSTQSRTSDNPEPGQPGDAGSSGADQQDPTAPARTGDQPGGPDDSDPGPGRKNGQRSSQPSSGERGSSQASSEGTPGGEQRGAGDPSQSPGNQSEGGKSGNPSPGKGRPSGSQPGESRPGESGSQSKSGDSGASQSQSGEPSDQSDGSPEESGSESGAKQSGNEPSPESKPGGEAGAPQDGAAQNESAGDQPGSDGKQAGGEQGGKQGGSKQGGEKSGGEQASGEQASGEQGGGEKGGSEQGGGEQGGGEQGGGEQGGGEQGGGEQGGGEQGGGEQGGGEQGGGEKGGGKQGGSGKQGDSQQGSGQGDGGEGTGQPGSPQASGGQGQPGNTPGGGSGNGSDNGQQSGQGAGGGGSGIGEGAEAADLNDKKRATELVLQRLQDELSRGEVSPDLLQDLGWSEENLRDFMERLDRRLSDTGEDQSPDARARRRQFTEILRGIDYSSEGGQQAADAGDRPVASGSGGIARKPAPLEFRKDEESFKQKQSRQTRSK